jgi:hypothetical protein
MRSDGLGPIVDHRPPQVIAFGIMREGVGVIAGIFEGLAEREMEVEPIFLAEIGGFERATHGGDVVRVEGDGLQVGQAPPGFAQ